MLVYLKRKDIDAVGDYFPEKKIFVVKAGSHVSSEVSTAEKFRGAKAIEKYREQYVRNGIVITDAVFSSSSTAGNFVTGFSTNGLTAWKTEDGRSLKDALDALN